MDFEWDRGKNLINAKKHGVSFEQAKKAFYDKKRVTVLDESHSSKKEKRYFCFGKVGGKVLTVRFTLRKIKVRIFGAGYWRQGRRKYHEKKED